MRKKTDVSSETSRRELLRKPEGISSVALLPVFIASLELGPDDWDPKGHLKAQGSNLEQRSSSNGFCSSGAWETTTDFMVAGKVNLANRLFLWQLNKMVNSRMRLCRDTPKKNASGQANVPKDKSGEMSTFLSVS